MRVLGFAILSVLRVSSAAESASDSCADDASLLQGGLREAKRIDRHQVAAEEKVSAEETGFVRGPPEFVDDVLDQIPADASIADVLDQIPDQIPAGASFEALLVMGDADGSCPAGTVRVPAEDCAGTHGHSLSDGTSLSNSHHETDCGVDFTPGAGCFVNVHGNVYSTASECAEAQTQPDNHAVCASLHTLVRGSSDGSCPEATSRVTPEDCPQLNGLSLSDGAALSNSHHRTDCARNFVHGEGCFVDDDGNVYSTAPACDIADAHGQPLWRNKHHAVCALRPLFAVVPLLDAEALRRLRSPHEPVTIDGRKKKN